MDIGIVVRENHAVWGGDLKVAAALKKGLEELGCRVTVGSSVLPMLEADFILLTNSTIDQRLHFDLLQLYKKPYAVLCFHEDCIQYIPPAYGFADYVQKCLEGYADNGVPFTLDRLLETPQIVHYFGFLPTRSIYYNYHVLQQARFCIAGSESEAKTLLRDCPAAKPAIIPLSPDFPSAMTAGGPDAFFDFAALPKDGYILQVGRMETRKNQLASILAARNLEAPLVFIATSSPQPWYEKLCLEAILAYRPHPTLVISESLDDFQSRQLTVKKMPKGEKLSSAAMDSAFQNAGLYLHPSFCEVPGFVFFEAARFGVPIVASEWCTIKDVRLSGPIEYPLPYDVPEIENKVRMLFGKKQKNSATSPLMARTALDYARDVLDRIVSAM